MIDYKHFGFVSNNDDEFETMTLCFKKTEKREYVYEIVNFSFEPFCIKSYSKSTLDGIKLKILHEHVIEKLYKELKIT